MPQRHAHKHTHTRANRERDWTRWIKINEFEIQSENFYWTRNLCGAKAKTAQNICFLSILVASCVWLANTVYTFESVRQKQHFEMYQIHLRFRSTNTHTSYRDARAPMMMQWPQNERIRTHTSSEWAWNMTTHANSVGNFLLHCMVYATGQMLWSLSHCSATTSN